MKTLADVGPALLVSCVPLGLAVGCTVWRLRDDWRRHRCRTLNRTPAVQVPADEHVAEDYRPDEGYCQAADLLARFPEQTRRVPACVEGGVR